MRPKFTWTQKELPISKTACITFCLNLHIPTGHQSILFYNAIFIKFAIKFFRFKTITLKTTLPGPCENWRYKVIVLSCNAFHYLFLRKFQISLLIEGHSVLIGLRCLMTVCFGISEKFISKLCSVKSRYDQMVIFSNFGESSLCFLYDSVATG